MMKWKQLIDTKTSELKEKENFPSDDSPGSTILFVTRTSKYYLIVLAL